MKEKVEITSNELRHYNSLKKQNSEQRKIIRKLQTIIRKLKSNQ